MIARKFWMGWNEAANTVFEKIRIAAKSSARQQIVENVFYIDVTLENARKQSF